MRPVTRRRYYMVSVVPSRSKDELGTTKVTDLSNYTLLTKAQHKDEDDDESVDKFKTDEFPTRH